MEWMVSYLLINVLEQGEIFNGSELLQQQTKRVQVDSLTFPIILNLASTSILTKLFIYSQTQIDCKFSYTFSDSDWSAIYIKDLLPNQKFKKI